MKKEYEFANYGGEVSDICNWLVDKGLLIRDTRSLELVAGSAVIVPEAVYSAPSHSLETNG